MGVLIVDSLKHGPPVFTPSLRFQAFLQRLLVVAMVLGGELPANCQLEGKATHDPERSATSPTKSFFEAMMGLEA